MTFTLPIPLFIWSVPFGVITGTIWGLAFGFAFKKYRATKTQSPFWLLIVVGAVGLGLSIGHVYNATCYDVATRAGAASPEVKESDANWIAYHAARTTASALPAKRPMTRAELVEFYKTNFPLALEHYARQGMQTTRNYLMQYFNPFFIFNNEEEKVAYAIKFFAARGVYQDSYPEYEMDIIKSL